MNGKFSAIASLVVLMTLITNPVPAQVGQLPVDLTVRYLAQELVIQGNTRISTAELLAAAPNTYNVSGRPLASAPAEDLYDLTSILALAAEPGVQREITARTIVGFCRYVLSEYQRRGYSGVFVSMPADNIVGGIELRDGKVVIQVMEAEVSQVGVSVFNMDKVEKEEAYIDLEIFKQWSPVREGEMINEKELNEFVNQINLNPDKHVTAVISRAEGDTLGVRYDLYERMPWRFYVQADSSGTGNRQWSPRVGIINTDVTGRMDRAALVYQARLDDIDGNYSFFGSYEVPLWTPALKLMGFGGYSEYDTNPVGTSPFTFHGS
ncbi:MAG TPA: hypothetical protein VLH60_06380, partial [Sedimentisphaerales bacterium]|nr:hypothetical protein [Sedimentisphaerales bacterium]